MDRVELTIFGLDRTALDGYIGQIRSLLDKKSAEYDGPKTFPVFKTHRPVDEIDQFEQSEDVPSWVRSLNIDNADLSRLQSFGSAEETRSLALFGRQIRIYGNDAVTAVMDLQLPDSVCLHVAVDTVNRSQGGTHSPYTYDPGRDHVTDVDFEAHQS